MRRVRRYAESARVEMAPLIDVVFLLLTFFIVSLLVTVRADVLPVALTPVGTGEAAEPGRIATLTIDAEGRFYLDRERIAPAALDRELAELAATPIRQRPRIFVAMEESLREAGPASGGAGVDRGPLVIELIDRLRRAGIENFAFIGDRP